jgi:hypothetical protein
MTNETFWITVGQDSGNVRGGNVVTIGRPRNRELKYPQGPLAVGARVQTSHPLVQALGVEGVVIEDLVLDGNLTENKDMVVEGCRNGCIHMCSNSPGQDSGPGRHIVRRCVARDFAGDGISWQGPAGVTVEEVECAGHTGNGLHPGTNALRALIRNCRSHHNGGWGLYVCWDVRQGRFENNVFEDNGAGGISTGRGDSDCLFAGNQIRRNRKDGIQFRRDKPPPDRCAFRGNVIEDNGGTGVNVQKNPSGTVLEKNLIFDTRQDEGQRTQKAAIASAVAVTLRDNTIEGDVRVPDLPGPAAR